MTTESFYAIRRTDGEPIGDYEWVTAISADDWGWVEEIESDNWDGPVEYEMVRMEVHPVATRTFGDPRNIHDEFGGICDYCDEPWPCEYVRDYDIANQPGSGPIT